MSASDGLVVVGVHSAKFPNEKVRHVGFVCMFLLYFCSWIGSINSCLFFRNYFFGRFSKVLKHFDSRNHEHKHAGYLKIVIYVLKIQCLFIFGDPQ